MRRWRFRRGTIWSEEVRAMALFNKEPDRNHKLEPTKGQPQFTSQPGPQPLTPTVAIATPAELTPTSPVRTAEPRLDQRAYLDSGSRISGKLTFEGPIRIDGSV